MELLLRTCHPDAIAHEHGGRLSLAERARAGLAHNPGVVVGGVGVIPEAKGEEEVAEMQRQSRVGAIEREMDANS